MTLKIEAKFKENLLVAWKMTWGIWQISPEHSKVSKLELWWDPLPKVENVWA